MAAWLALYLLICHTSSPKIIGISESVAHAQVVYQPLKYTVNNSPGIAKLLRATETRGIHKRDGTGSYMVKPAIESKLQGLAIRGGAIIDEIHLLPRGAWDSLVGGQGAQEHSLIIGLTTAGDDSSLLLKNLYVRADRAIATPDSDIRFGAFIYESPAGSTLQDHDAIKQANPAIAAGRISLETRLADVADHPEFTRRRYLMNQFVSNSNVWLGDPALWTKNRGVADEAIRDLTAKRWYAIDVTPGWHFASIAAARKNDAGFIDEAPQV